MSPSSDGSSDDVLPAHLIRWDRRDYCCPNCSMSFRKWGDCVKHRAAEHPCEPPLTAKECRLLALRAATNMVPQETDALCVELAQRVASSGDARFAVSNNATPDDLALLWELSTSIGLFCRIEGGDCVIRKTAFESPSFQFSAEDRALVEDVEGGGGETRRTKKRRKKKKKRTFLRAVSDAVSEISLDRTRERKKARCLLNRHKHDAAHLEGDGTDRGGFLNMSGGGGDAAQLTRRGVPRGVDNRPAWLTSAPPPLSAPAMPITEGKGYEMLLRLGWTNGKGLGKSAQGICTPIEAAKRARRLGIGAAP